MHPDWTGWICCDLPADVPRRNSRQLPLFPVQMFIPEPLEPGSVYDMLARYSGFVIQRSDFPTADPSLGGHDGHCPVLLSKLVLFVEVSGWHRRHSAPWMLARSGYIGLHQTADPRPGRGVVKQASSFICSQKAEKRSANPAAQQQRRQDLPCRGYSELAAVR